MIKELIHDPILLARKSEVATKEDLQAAQDLKIKLRYGDEQSGYYIVKK